MIGRRSTIGLALLCAFAFSAFVAQSAMAQKGTHSTNTTAFTCVPEGGNLDFEDAHCDKKVAPPNGPYGHELIAKNTTTEIETPNVGASNLKGILGGVNAEIECKKAASVAEESFIHNVEVESKHTVTGTVKINFTECTVAKPSKCKVKEPIVTTASFQGVEGLNEGKNEMGVEFKGEGAEETFAEIYFENKSAEEKCSLTNGGKPFLVKGSAIATGNTATQKEAHSGATSVFETGPESNRMETLKIGAQDQQFTGSFTTKMSGGHPISLTTVT